MDYYSLIKLLYPTIKNSEFQLGYTEASGIQINFWTFSGAPQPTIADLNLYASQMTQYDSLVSAASQAQEYLDSTDHMIWRNLENSSAYPIDPTVVSQREDARNAIRSLRNFKLVPPA